MHNELFSPNEKLLGANCGCKEMTLFCYERTLYRIEVWPLERIYQRFSMATILERLNNFSFKAKNDPCRSCRIDYKEVVKAAQKETESYFNGLCLDCMNRTKSVTRDADMDRLQHGSLSESYFKGSCRCEHKEPTRYFSFMGDREVRDSFLRN